MSDVFTFDKFQPGATLGTSSETLTPALLAEWTALYPWDQPADGDAPLGMTSVLMMRAYLKIVTPRPPGNVHGSQRFTVGAPPRVGETVDSTVRCLAKTMKGERRFVDLELIATGAHGRPLFTGVMTMLWAA